MPELRFGGSDGSSRSVPITIAQPSRWPAGLGPEPVMPTGLPVQVGGTFDNSLDGREYRGMRDDFTCSRKRIVLRDCSIPWINLNGGAEDVWIIGGRLGPQSTGAHPAISNGFNALVAKRVVLDGVLVEGMRGGVNDHTEGVQVGGVETLWIRGCTFRSNQIFNVFLRCWSPAPIRNVLIEDCDLWPTVQWDGRPALYTLRVAGDGDSAKPTDVVIRNNRLHGGGVISVDGSAVRVRVENNTVVT